jgi:hypothetical protein
LILSASYINRPLKGFRKIKRRLRISFRRLRSSTMLMR